MNADKTKPCLSAFICVHLWPINAFLSYVIDQPLRTVGVRYLFASTLLVIFIFDWSYSSLPSTRNAITPSSIHSTNGAATLKLEQAGSPPLQARIQSR